MEPLDANTELVHVDDHGRPEFGRLQFQAAVLLSSRGGNTNGVYSKDMSFPRQESKSPAVENKESEACVPDNILALATGHCEHVRTTQNVICDYVTVDVG